MKTFLNRTKWALCLAGTLALTVPAAVGATSESSERWNQAQAELQRNLAPGQPADIYRRKLEELGYKVTSVNYDKPEYVEYEVVKGDQTWEVQIDVDDNTHRATKVDIVANAWKTDATKQEIKRNKQMATGNEPTYSEGHRTAAIRNNQYSDRDRTTTDQLVKELEGLPVGHDKQFYKEVLHKQGYDISRIDKDETDELKLEAVKNGYSVKMDIAFGEDTGRSTKIDASSLWAESESTTRAREAQQMGRPYHKGS
jgi:uncharacterized protein YmfQ (DUF2313 family)